MRNIYALFGALIFSGAISSNAQQANSCLIIPGEEEVSGSGVIQVQQRKSSDKSFEVIFIVDMTNAVAEGGVVFNPEIHQVYISGSFIGWPMPGSDTNYELQPVAPKRDEGTDTSAGHPAKNLLYSITFEIEEGLWYYKYFLVQDDPTWNLGEWAGDPNREVLIAGPATINNVWGNLVSFAGGDGSPENPFQVATPEHLNSVRYFPLAHYKQIADIDLGVSPWNEGGGWISIGNDYEPFRGSFNGNGFTISNMTINQPQNLYLGLFGFVVEGLLMNVSIESATITGQSFGGILCGYTIATQIMNCSTSGEISIETNWAGGLTGVANQTQIFNSYSIANIQSSGYSIGGLTGAIEENSVIFNCYATGNVSGSSFVGGLAGWTGNYCQVNNSYSTGMVSGVFDTGGLIGGGYDLTSNNSYWNIETSNQAISYGGTPKNTAELLQQNTYTAWDFTNIWSITPGETYAYLQIQNEPAWFNYPPSFLSPSNFSAVPYDHEIKLTWISPSLGNPSAINLYRNEELYQTLGVETTVYLDQGLENFLYYSYSLTAQYGEDESDPTLVISTFANPGFSAGDGSYDNPFLVDSPDELYTVRIYPYKVFMQTADIDLGVSAWKDGEGWLPIGDNDQRATLYYDGNGFKISNLTINRPEKDFIGLFGAIQDTNLWNIALENVNITGNSYTGALTGFSSNCDIYQCYSTGQVLGENILGGLVGTATNYSYLESSFAAMDVIQNEASNQQAGGLVGRLNESEVLSCFSSGNVSGSDYSGGLIGGVNAFSFVFGSYATGNVEGNNFVGGLVGSIQNSTFALCYSTGEVSGNIAGGLIGESFATDGYYSYWDTETSMQSSSYGGTPKTTAAMTQEATFENWDFEDTWAIQENTTYPYLQWQLGPWEHNYPASQSAIEEPPENALRVFPNPAWDRVWIEFDSPNGTPLQVQLLNLQGQIVDQQIIEEPGKIRMTFNTNKLSAGIYLLVIRGETLNLAEKLIIE
ncbi:MAG: T9SS type A sorting domain-containing protein [Bacteroides sp.]|nr:T9SS type A sorting domain-containing protein [Bacteroides sp.]